MTDLVLRVECQGEVLGEFPMDRAPVVLRLQDGDTGRVITTLTLEPAQPDQAHADEPNEVSQPRVGFGSMPSLESTLDLYKDETAKIDLSGDDTLAKGIQRIREASKAAAIINLDLPADVEAEAASPIAPVSPDEQAAGIEILELSEPSADIDSAIGQAAADEADEQPVLPTPIAPEEPQPEPIKPPQGDTLKLHRDDPVVRVVQRQEPEPRPEPPAAEPEKTESDVAPLPAPPTPERDRSVTHTLSNGLVDLIQMAEREARELREAARPRSTITDRLPDDGGRPTHVEHPEAIEDDGEGPPTRVSRNPFVPQPIAPEAPSEPGAALGDDTRSLEDSESGTELPVEDLSVEVGTDFAEEDDEPVTVVAEAPLSVRARRPLSRGEYDELPVGRGRAAGDDLSLGLPQDPGLVGPPRGYDELPVPEASRREPGDDLSLSLPYDAGLTDASIDELSLPVPSPTGEHTGAPVDASLSLSLPLPDGLYEADSDDDITLPLPEDSEVSDSHAPIGDIGGEATVSSGFAAMSIGSLGQPQQVRPRLLDTTAGFDRDPSTERLEGAEVWFRRQGEWTPRGALDLNQHVQAFGGMVRCDEHGGLVVLAGPRLHGSATLPSGELRQISSGQQAVHLPPGTSVIMWQGEQGIYVRSNVAADTSGPVLDQGPVEYRRPPRSRAWKPPASDLEDS